MENIEEIKVLWNYMKMNQQLKKADCIIGLGSVDTNVANVASELYLQGYADKVFFSGGLGKITNKIWNETEAEKFAKRYFKNYRNWEGQRLSRGSRLCKSLF